MAGKSATINANPWSFWQDLHNGHLSTFVKGIVQAS